MQSVEVLMMKCLLHAELCWTVREENLLGTVAGENGECLE